MFLAGEISTGKQEESLEKMIVYIEVLTQRQALGFASASTPIALANKLLP